MSIKIAKISCVSAMLPYKHPAPLAETIKKTLPSNYKGLWMARRIETGDQRRLVATDDRSFIIVSGIQYSRCHPLAFDC